MQNQDELTPAESELELDLKLLRPAPARIDLVAAESTARRRASYRRMRRWQASVAAAAIGGLVAWMAASWRGAQPINGGTGIESTVELAEASEPVEPPTQLTYRRAMLRSAAEFDALLDQHAMSGGMLDVGIPSVEAATVWEVGLHSSIGDL
jgi:hypothetical protein